jgi:hypothetical protein
MTVEAFPAKSTCIVCAARLEPSARKCTTCDAFQDGRECISCGTSLPAAASRCGACKTLQEGIPCRACGARLEKGRRRCSDCSEWQSLRRYLPASQITIALTISLISVLSAVIPPVLAYYANRSQTFVRVLGDGQYTPQGAHNPEKSIVVLAANNGKRASLVKSASIRFDGVSAAPMTLDILNATETLILPERQVYLHLSADHVQPVNGASAETILESLANGTATVTVQVEETDIRGRFYDAQPAPSHIINGTGIYDWMNAHVATQ